MEFSGIYKVSRSASISTAINIIQIKAGTKPFKVLRAWVTQSDQTGSAQTAIQLLRKSTSATVTAAVIADVIQIRPSDTASTVVVSSTTGTGFISTVNGTDGDVIIEEGFNILNGWLYLPIPEERIIVPANGTIALKFPVAPSSATYRAGIIFGELG